MQPYMTCQTCYKGTMELVQGVEHITPVFMDGSLNNEAAYKYEGEYIKCNKCGSVVRNPYFTRNGTRVSVSLFTDEQKENVREFLDVVESTTEYTVWKVAELCEDFGLTVTAQEAGSKTGWFTVNIANPVGGSVNYTCFRKLSAAHIVRAIVQMYTNEIIPAYNSDSLEDYDRLCNMHYIKAGREILYKYL